MPADPKAKRAAEKYIKTQVDLDRLLERIADPELRAATLERLRPHLSFEPKENKA